MKFTEIEQNLDRTKVHESREYPEWTWNLMLKFREMRCKNGKHQMKNHWGEDLTQCKWCGVIKVEKCSNCGEAVGKDKEGKCANCGC